MAWEGGGSEGGGIRPFAFAFAFHNPELQRGPLPGGVGCGGLLPGDGHAGPVPEQRLGQLLTVQRRGVVQRRGAVVGAAVDRHAVVQQHPHHAQQLALVGHTGETEEGRG